MLAAFLSSRLEAWSTNGATSSSRSSQEKAYPVTEMNRGSVFGLFRGRRSAEKVSYQRGHFFQVLLQCEMTRVEEMEFGVFQILRVEPRALDRENPIILS